MVGRQFMEDELGRRKAWGCQNSRSGHGSLKKREWMLWIWRNITWRYTGWNKYLFFKWKRRQRGMKSRCASQELLFAANHKVRRDGDYLGLFRGGQKQKQQWHRRVLNDHIEMLCLQIFISQELHETLDLNSGKTNIIWNCSNMCTNILMH
jgi:hypothetical protein